MGLVGLCLQSNWIHIGGFPKYPRQVRPPNKAKSIAPSPTTTAKIAALLGNLVVSALCQLAASLTPSKTGIAAIAAGGPIATAKVKNVRSKRPITDPGTDGMDEEAIDET